MVITNKRGQMKIQQMIFMILTVFILFVLVGLFFLSISLSNLKKTATNLQETNAMLLVSNLANSPELSCGNAFGSSLTSCVDFDKAMALQSNPDYSDFWGVAKIEIRKIYPEEGDIACDTSNYPNCSIIWVLDNNISSTPAVSNFVSLCRIETDQKIVYTKCELALLLVSSINEGGG